MRASRWVFCVCIVLAAGCGGGGGGGGGQANARVVGQAFKGQVANGTFQVFKMSETGSRLEPPLASGQTDQNGNFGPVDIDCDGVVLVCITGGTFIDEATRNPETISEDEPLYGLAEVERGQTRTLDVTPLTTLVFLFWKAFTIHPDACPVTAFFNAKRMVELMFGVDGICDVSPSNLAAGQSDGGVGDEAGAAIGAWSEAALRLGIHPLTLTHAVGRDFRDGMRDGRELNRDIEISIGVNLLEDWHLALRDGYEIVEFGALNAAGIDRNDLQGDDNIGNLGQMLFRVPQTYGVQDNYSSILGGQNVKLIGTFDENVEVEVENKMQPTSALTEGNGAAITTTAFDTPGKKDIVIRDPTTRLMWTAKNALRVFDETVVPSNLMITPRILPEVGGSIAKLEGDNLTPDLTYECGGGSVPVVAASFPNVVWLEMPPGTGTATLEVLKNQSVVAMTTVTYVFKDLGLQEDGVGLRDQKLFGTQWTFEEGGGQSVTVFQTCIEWDNEDQGTFTRIEHTISTQNPTRTQTTRSGDSFRAIQGRVETVGNFGQEFLGFHKFFLQEGLGTGLTGNGFSMKMVQPTQLTAQATCGLYFLNGFQFDPTGRFWRQVVGTVEMGPDNQGGLNVRCRTRDTDGSFEDLLDLFDCPFTWSLDPGGSFTITMPDGFETAELEGQFDEQSRVAFVHGGTPDSIIFGLLLRAESGLGTSVAFGGNLGGTAFQANEIDNGMQPFYDFEILEALTSLDGPWGLSLVFCEGAAKRPGATREELVENVNTVSSITDSAGVATVDGNWSGFFAPYNRLSLPIGRFSWDPDGAVSAFPMAFGLLIGMDMYFGPNSLGGRDYNALTAKLDFGEEPGDPPNGDEFTEYRSGRRSFDAKKLQVNGHTYDLTGSVGLGGSGVDVEKFVNRFGGSSLIGGTTTTTEPLGQVFYAGCGTKIYLLAKPPPNGIETVVPLARGTMTADGQMISLGGFGRDSKLISQYMARIDNGPPSFAGRWNFGALEVEYGMNDLATISIVCGDMELQELGIPELNATTYCEGEDGSSLTGTTNRFLSAGLVNDDFIEIGMSGDDGFRIYRGIITADGECMVLMDYTNGTTQGVMFAVREALSAPTLCNYLLTGLTHTFEDAATPFPRTNFQQTQALVTFAGPRQVNTTGIAKILHNYEPSLSVQQIFDVNQAQPPGVDGSLTVNAGGETLSGFLSPNGRWAFIKPPDRIDIHNLAIR